MAHRDLASRIHVRNAAESGQTRTDANDPQPTSFRDRTLKFYERARARPPPGQFLQSAPL